MYYGNETYLRRLKGKCAVRSDLEMFDNVYFVAFLTVCVCGAIGVLVDLDHAVARYIFHVRSNEALRIGHKSMFILSIVALCGIGAYIGRLVLG